MNRRTALGYGAVCTAAMVAGCLFGTGDEVAGDHGAESGENSDDERNDDEPEDGRDGTERDTDDEGGYNENDPTLLEYDVTGYSVEDGQTRVEPLFSRADADEVIDFDGLSDDEKETTTRGGSVSALGRSSETDSAKIRAFVDETDFDDSMILLLRESVDTKCIGIDVQEVETEGDRLSVRARTVDEGTPEQDCPAESHAPTVLGRAVFENQVPRAGTVAFDTSTGETRTIEYDGRRGVDGNADV